MVSSKELAPQVNSPKLFIISGVSYRLLVREEFDSEVCYNYIFGIEAIKRVTVTWWNLFKIYFFGFTNKYVRNFIESMPRD